MYDVLGFIVKNIARITSEPKPSYTWDRNISGNLPHVEGFKNINGTKCFHKRRALKLMICGHRLTAMQYADDYNSTKLTSRISELRNHYGLNIQDVWIPAQDGKNGYKEYFFNTNEVVR